MARKLQVVIVGGTRSFEASLRRASGATKGFGSSMSTAGRLARTAGLAVTAGFAVGIGKAISAAGDFEQSLNVFQSVTKASGKQMAEVSGLAKDLGNDLSLPATSAKDAADA